MTVIDENKEVITKLYRLGFISCTVFEHNDMYKHYLESKDVFETAEHFGVSTMTLYRIIKKFKTVTN